MSVLRAYVALVIIIPALRAFPAENTHPQFMPLESATPVLQQFAANNSAGPSTSMTPRQWQSWLQKSDEQVRERLDRGEEDSLTNLLRFGVTFTKEYRIDDDYLARYGHSSLVNAFAENRASDLVRTLARPSTNQGFVEMREFVEKKGFSLNSAAGRSKLKAYLLANLARLQQDFLEARKDAKTNRDQMFEHRGISLDSNLWPDYALDFSLQNILKDRLLKPGSIRRLAIVGPGLDFVNKQEGVDYYPPQSTQPFAVLDSLLRLGIASPDAVQIYTFDISPRVNLHLDHATKAAAQGRDYIVQLPWYEAGRWTEEFRASFTDYWKQLGEHVGDAVPAIPVPQASPGFATRAMKVRPTMVRRITPVDMNIVFQRLPLAADDRFDLIIGTNIFLYYSSFEQSLACINLASMLKPGGLLLSSDKLVTPLPAGLEQAFVTAIPMTTPPVMTDYIYAYRSAAAR